MRAMIMSSFQPDWSVAALVACVYDPAIGVVGSSAAHDYC